MAGFSKLVGAAAKRAGVSIPNVFGDSPQYMAHGFGHGTASLAIRGFNDMEGVFDRHGSVAVPLGLDQPGSKRGAVWTPGHLQGHALTFGATRSGKGTCSIMPTLLTYAGSMLIVDPKAEAVWVAADRRRQLGQRVVILDPWDEVAKRYGVEKSTKFNPLSALRADDKNFADDVTAIADTLIIGGADSESHWNNSARELLAGLIAAAVERNPGKASLRYVRKMVTADDEELAEAIKDMVAENPDSLSARKLRRFSKATGENGSIRSSAVTQTAILDSEALLDAMETDEAPFDLAELATGRVTLFLVLPVDRLVTHGRWLRMLLTLTLRAISRQPKPPKLPVIMSLDEAGSSLGNLQPVESAYGLLAGLGVRLWLYLQDLNQLERDYPKSWRTFVANSSVIQVLTARDDNTSEYFSKYLGNTTVGEDSKRVRSIQLWSDKDYKARQPEARPLLDPDQVRKLPADKQLVIYPGIASILMSRLFYYQDPRFNGLYRPLPEFGGAMPVKAAAE